LPSGTTSQGVTVTFNVAIIGTAGT
jgi:hypothetical protein